MSKKNIKSFIASKNYGKYSIELARHISVDDMRKEVSDMCNDFVEVYSGFDIAKSSGFTMGIETDDKVVIKIFIPISNKKMEDHILAHEAVHVSNAILRHQLYGSISTSKSLDVNDRLEEEMALLVGEIFLHVKEMLEETDDEIIKAAFVKGIQWP